ncbi:MAG TPA: tetratricopeptide repeat protein, partial [Sphingomonadales bacterium]|nr:tetratricopeptide repeat protein [Sphingomonadales bacterium]
MSAASELARAKENLATENFARVRRICERILQTEPDSSEALALLATAEMRRLRFREAAPFFERALKEQPDRPENWDKLGYCYLRLRLPEKALAAYRHALKAQTPPFEALAGAAHILTGHGKTGEARALLQQAMRLYPDNPEGWRMLSVLTDFRAEPKVLAALEGLQSKVLHLPPNDQAQLYYALAIAYEALGRKDNFRAAVE